MPYRFDRRAALRALFNRRILLHHSTASSLLLIAVLMAKSPATLDSRRGGRVVDGSGLENRQGASPRGFESHPLRHSNC